MHSNLQQTHSQSRFPHQKMGHTNRRFVQSLMSWWYFPRRIFPRHNAIACVLLWGFGRESILDHFDQVCWRSNGQMSVQWSDLHWFRFSRNLLAVHFEMEKCQNSGLTNAQIGLISQQAHWSPFLDKCRTYIRLYRSPGWSGTLKNILLRSHSWSFNAIGWYL